MGGTLIPDGRIQLKQVYSRSPEVIHASASDGDPRIPGGAGPVGAGKARGGPQEVRRSNLPDHGKREEGGNLYPEDADRSRGRPEARDLRGPDRQALRQLD